MKNFGKILSIIICINLYACGSSESESSGLSGRLSGGSCAQIKNDELILKERPSIRITSDEAKCMRVLQSQKRFDLCQSSDLKIEQYFTNCNLAVNGIPGTPNAEDIAVALCQKFELCEDGETSERRRG